VEGDAIVLSHHCILHIMQQHFLMNICIGSSTTLYTEERPHRNVCICNVLLLH